MGKKRSARKNNRKILEQNRLKPNQNEFYIGIPVSLILILILYYALAYHAPIMLNDMLIILLFQVSQQI